MGVLARDDANLMVDLAFILWQADLQEAIMVAGLGSSRVHLGREEEGSLKGAEADLRLGVKAAGAGPEGRPALHAR